MSETPAALATPEERAAALYETLKLEAIAAARQYVLSRTPTDLQEAMVALVDPDFPAPTPLPAEDPPAQPYVAPPPA